MMLVGFFGISFMMRRQRSKDAVAAT